MRAREPASSFARKLDSHTLLVRVIVKRDYRSGRSKLSFCHWKKAETASDKNDQANFSGKKSIRKLSRRILRIRENIKLNLVS